MSQKVFIAKDNTATFVCPECQKSKTADVSKYKNIEKAVRVNFKCPCGHSYSVLLERRKHIRKQLNLSGSFINKKNSERGNMSITDLSRSGLRIKLNFPQNLEPGDKLDLEFTLDDKLRSVVKKEVIVRSVKDLSVGVEFIHSEHFDKLGPYLLFNFD
jgi:predicted RNA-binding Zn-ribbon protein involved in translation (DUF1610 family)